MLSHIIYLLLNLIYNLYNHVIFFDWRKCKFIKIDLLTNMLICYYVIIYEWKSSK